VIGEDVVISKVILDIILVVLRSRLDPALAARAGVPLLALSVAAAQALCLSRLGFRQRRLHSARCSVSSSCQRRTHTL
jgi:hypothetical protein